MKISNYAVKNYQFTLIIFLMVIVVGITTILNMPRAEDPDMNAPQFPIIVVFPGTSPEDMEDLIVDPIEKKVNSLEDIKKINIQLKQFNSDEELDALTSTELMIVLNCKCADMNNLLKNLSK